MYPALFLDRDGVLIENVDAYVRSWTDVSVFPGAIAALASLRQRDIKIFIVTNQAVVGKGIITLAEAHQINEKLMDAVASAGGRIDKIYICPHRSDENCACRKPRPGLIRQAVEEFQIDLERSILVGDALTDIQAGQAAGIRTNILVRTGRGREQEKLVESLRLPPFAVEERLEDVIAAYFGTYKC